MASGKTPITVTVAGGKRFPFCHVAADGWTVSIYRANKAKKCPADSTRVEVRVLCPSDGSIWGTTTSSSLDFEIALLVGPARLRAMGEYVKMLWKTGLGLTNWTKDRKNELARHIRTALAGLSADELRRWNHEKGPRPK